MDYFSQKNYFICIYIYFFYLYKTRALRTFMTYIHNAPEIALVPNRFPLALRFASIFNVRISNVFGKTPDGIADQNAK